MSEEITIHVGVLSSVVYPGKTKGARLMWQAPGLNVYVRGSCPASTIDRVGNVAINAAQARNIPAMAVRYVGPRYDRQEKQSDAQKKLWDDWVF